MNNPNPTNDNAGGQPGEVGKTNNTQKKFYYPSALLVKGRVLGALLRGERITHLDCWRRFGSARLSHHVYVLRGIGWPVLMIEEQVVTSDAGRTAVIGIYSLSPDVIAEAGERGRQFAAETARIEAERKAA